MTRKRIKSFVDFVKESIAVDKIKLPSYEETTVEYLPYSSAIKNNSISFQKKLVAISKSLGINPKWLMVMLNDLSRFNEKERDTQTKATGLLKFFPWSVTSFVDSETGKSIKTKDILGMSNLEQLDLINSYYDAWIEKLEIKKPLSPGDFAAIIFYPAIIKKDWEYTFPDEVIAANNDFFSNFSKDGKKTKKDYYEYMERVLRDPKETEAKDIFGDFTGAMFDPYTFNTKEALDKYKIVIEGLLKEEDSEEDREKLDRQLVNDVNVNYETDP
jgi:hypothetical protein